jgi:hypothetical protein
LERRSLALLRATALAPDEARKEKRDGSLPASAVQVRTGPATEEDLRRQDKDDERRQREEDKEKKTNWG